MLFIFCFYGCYIGSFCFILIKFHCYFLLVVMVRDVTVWAILNTLMPILQILLEVLRRLRTVFVCMKRITGYYGSIKIGGQA